MRNKSHACVIVLAIFLASGCYSSAPARHDGASDPAHDPMVDPAYDPYVDPWTDPDAPPLCQPDYGFYVGFEISGTPIMEPDSLTRECWVEWSIFEEPDWFEITLACPDTDGLIVLCTIDVYTMSEVYAFIPDGTPVTFSYVQNTPWWLNRWFSIRYSGGDLFLAGVDATDLTPYGRDPYEWYGPLGVYLATGLCPWTPGDCGDEERTALAVSFEDMNGFIFDGNEGWIGMWGMFHVIVDTAVVYHNIRCEDFYGSWIRALFVSLPVR
jgi:hypothetical protein